MKTQIGGNRLGSGNKLEAELHGYSRSTHDLSYLWKSTMAPGTLVPFMNILALPGDTFDIELDSIVKTHPTIGPLFGSFKLQLDVFTAPIRLYNKNLHNNKLGVGMNMASIKFPLLALSAEAINTDSNVPPEFQQINQSCILAYLGIRGLAGNGSRTVENTPVYALKNAIPYLAYWDIYKNYYANKQEDHGYVIHGNPPTISYAHISGVNPPHPIASYLEITDVMGNNITPENVQLQFTGSGWLSLKQMAFDNQSIRIIEPGKHIQIWVMKKELEGQSYIGSRIDPDASANDIKPSLNQFLIKNIDDMRDNILSHVGPDPFFINFESTPPYCYPLYKQTGETMCAINGQEGLAVKTYQSDIFNNWISTEWIEGTGSISAITAISTAGDSFTIDTLNLSKKVYDMLNRVAVSGGSYEDYIEAVYDHKGKWRAETPVYHGGLSKEIVFQEVVSNAATSDEPLGTLAGKGTMHSKHKGGKIIINVDEPCFILGIVSITPRVNYSQGNDWTSNLTTMDDLHKPALDGIGYQDLITDQMAFWDSIVESNVNYFKSAGKQPAWLNYMTNFDKSYGNFADPRNQMFMTLDRRYSFDGSGIEDLTTYIDPSKFNYAFAQVDLSAQNFWTQIGCNITARRKMSAKIIPNL